MERRRPACVFFFELTNFVKKSRKAKIFIQTTLLLALRSCWSRPDIGGNPFMSFFVLSLYSVIEILAKWVRLKSINKDFFTLKNYDMRNMSMRTGTKSLKMWRRFDNHLTTCVVLIYSNVYLGRRRTCMFLYIRNAYKILCNCFVFLSIVYKRKIFVNLRLNVSSYMPNIQK